jgi:hypothetical protein
MPDRTVYNFSPLLNGMIMHGSRFMSKHHDLAFHLRARHVIDTIEATFVYISQVKV